MSDRLFPDRTIGGDNPNPFTMLMDEQEADTAGRRACTAADLNEWDTTPTTMFEAHAWRWTHEASR